MFVITNCLNPKTLPSPHGGWMLMMMVVVSHFRESVFMMWAVTRTGRGQGWARGHDTTHIRAATSLCIPRLSQGSQVAKHNHNHYTYYIGCPKSLCIPRLSQGSQVDKHNHSHYTNYVGCPKSLCIPRLSQGVPGGQTQP